MLELWCSFPSSSSSPLLVSFECPNKGCRILFLDVRGPFPSEEVTDTLHDLVQEELDPEVHEEDHTHQKGDANLVVVRGEGEPDAGGWWWWWWLVKVKWWKFVGSKFFLRKQKKVQLILNLRSCFTREKERKAWTNMYVVCNLSKVLNQWHQSRSLLDNSNLLWIGKRMNCAFVVRTLRNGIGRGGKHIHVHTQLLFLSFCFHLIAEGEELGSILAVSSRTQENFSLQPNSLTISWLSQASFYPNFRCMKSFLRVLRPCTQPLLFCQMLPEMISFVYT